MRKTILTVSILTFVAGNPTFGRTQSDSRQLESDINELKKERVQKQKFYEALQLKSENSENDVPLTENMKKAKALLNNPFIQKYMEVFQNPKLHQALQSIWEHPNRQSVFVVEGVWLLFIIILRAWRFSRIAESRWIYKLWNRFLIMIFYFLGIVAIPVFLIGQPAIDALKVFWDF